MTLISPLNHHQSKICCLTERYFMKKLNGGCSIPLGCKTFYNEKEFKIWLNLTSIDSKKQLNVNGGFFIDEEFNGNESLIERKCFELVDGLVEELKGMGCDEILNQIERH